MHGVEDGAVIIKRDGIIYGYSNSEYGAGGLYFVPEGTDANDYERVLKNRIDKYLGTDNEVKLEKMYFDFNDGILRHVVNASTVVLKSLDMSIDEYYQRYNTNLEKECSKTDSDCSEYTNFAIAVPAYKMILNGKEYEVGIRISSTDRSFLLSDIVTIVSQNKANIIHVESKVMQDKISVLTLLTVLVKNAEHLRTLMANLKKINSVVFVERITR